ncbi:hypothetical protein [Bradyrhizobium sp. WSM3983]|uniref:hypothetical protein n=1 Tax=Bradyrhizobium sp. WSM3983 TaxID=1038867 RepID=UPI000403B5AD|nr:hypothetical protein [Bradyrhizobium sp. WSM3983]
MLAALIVVPFGRGSIAWFSSIAFLAIVILWRIGGCLRCSCPSCRSTRVNKSSFAALRLHTSLAIAVCSCRIFATLAPHPRVQ